MFTITHHPSSTVPVKKFFLKRLKVHGPSGGDLKDILFLCDICQGVLFIEMLKLTCINLRVGLIVSSRQ